MCAQKVSVRTGEAWITEEHLVIRALLDRLRSINDPGILLPMLKELYKTLDDHFSREEGEEGLHAIIAEITPEHAAQVDALLLEHRALLLSTNALITECNACVSGPVAELKKGVGELFSRLQKHDAVETEILTDAVLHEIDTEAD